MELKSIFKESVNLHFIDKENNSFYKNVDDTFIINKIGEKFRNFLRIIKNIKQYAWIHIMNFTNFLYFF